MTATSVLDPLYSVTAGGAAFSITLAGYGTVALAGGASAAAVRPLQYLLVPGNSCGVRTVSWVYGVGPIKIVFDHAGGSTAPAP